ncbi:hypothetical protein AXG93_3242s1560 [Marchantia polymorpha subsp. ruderalis]|uniref:Uncharacterized protein n=1 Tax=Marchantia polymorpha subsp. ruderalis TaxID=1480154 RepID=A0A176WIQ6_MARPO|nr:hypothetical protein AXG93_3242s1560 [Marchantia polymorpha subsp. ruderalis]
MCRERDVERQLGDADLLTSVQPPTEKDGGGTKPPKGLSVKLGGTNPDKEQERVKELEKMDDFVRPVLGPRKTSAQSPRLLPYFPKSAITAPPRATARNPSPVPASRATARNPSPTPLANRALPRNPSPTPAPSRAGARNPSPAAKASARSSSPAPAKPSSGYGSAAAAGGSASLKPGLARSTTSSAPGAGATGGRRAVSPSLARREMRSAPGVNRTSSAEGAKKSMPSVLFPSSKPSQQFQPSVMSTSCSSDGSSSKEECPPESPISTKRLSALEDLQALRKHLSASTSSSSDVSSTTSTKEELPSECNSPVISGKKLSVLDFNALRKYRESCSSSDGSSSKDEGLPEPESPTISGKKLSALDMQMLKKHRLLNSFGKRAGPPKAGRVACEGMLPTSPVHPTDTKKRCHWITPQSGNALELLLPPPSFSFSPAFSLRLCFWNLAFAIAARVLLLYGLLRVLIQLYGDAVVVFFLDGRTSPRKASHGRDLVYFAEPIIIAYHDEEWGVPVHNDKMLFELMVLEGAQSELSRPQILALRDYFREVFAGFDPEIVARFDEKKIASLAADDTIRQTEAKVRGVIENAKQVVKIAQEFGSFNKYLWMFVGFKPIVNLPRLFTQVPVKSSKSEALSRDLMRRGFRYVGPTTIYSFMQAAESLSLLEARQTLWVVHGFGFCGSSPHPHPHPNPNPNPRERRRTNACMGARPTLQYSQSPGARGRGRHIGPTEIRPRLRWGQKLYGKARRNEKAWRETEALAGMSTVRGWDGVSAANARARVYDRPPRGPRLSQSPPGTQKEDLVGLEPWTRPSASRHRSIARCTGESLESSARLCSTPRHPLSSPLALATAKAGLSERQSCAPVSAASGSCIRVQHWATTRPPPPPPHPSVKTTIIESVTSGPGDPLPCPGATARLRILEKVLAIMRTEGTKRDVSCFAGLMG